MSEISTELSSVDCYEFLSTREMMEYLTLPLACQVKRMKVRHGPIDMSNSHMHIYYIMDKPANI